MSGRNFRAGWAAECWLSRKHDVGRNERSTCHSREEGNPDNVLPDTGFSPSRERHSLRGCTRSGYFCERPDAVDRRFMRVHPIP